MSRDMSQELREANSPSSLHPMLSYSEAMWDGGVEGEGTKMLLLLDASLLQVSSSCCGMLAPRIYKVQKGWEIT